jgi:site-specific recombinase XerD
MTLHFYLDLQRPKQGEFPVICRITVDRKKTEFQVPFSTCPTEGWDKTAECALPSATMYLEINRQIQSFKAKAAEIQYEYSKAGKTLTLSVLKSYLLGKQKTHWNLLDYANQYIEKREKIEGERVGIKHIAKTMEYVKEFIEKKGQKDIPIDHINKGWITDLHNFFKFYKIDHYNKRFALSTIHKHFSKIKTVLHDAVNNDIIAKNPFDGYRITKPKSNRVGLEPHELKALIELDLTPFSELDNVRCAFVFCCFTGLRYSDSQNMLMSNVRLNKTNNRPELHFLQLKTSNVVDTYHTVPLIKHATAIMDKYKNYYVRKFKGKLLPKLTNQHCNRILKELALMAEIEMELTFHISRHTIGVIGPFCGFSRDMSNAWIGHSQTQGDYTYSHVVVNALHQHATKLEEYLDENVWRVTAEI